MSEGDYPRVRNNADMTTAPCTKCRRTMHRAMLHAVDGKLVCKGGSALSCVPHPHAQTLRKLARECLNP